MTSIKRFISKNKVLLLLILLALLLRIPWLYTTIERDEGVFGYSTWRMLSGDKNYLEMWDVKPPFLHLLYAIPLYFFGNSIIPVRIFNNILFLISIVFFFKLVESFFLKRTACFSTLFYAVFMNVRIFQGYLALSESFLTPFLIISIYLFKKYTESKKYYLLISCSIFATASIFIKLQSIFIYLLLTSGVFIYKGGYKIRKILIITSPLLLVGLIIFFVNDALILNLLQLTWQRIFHQSIEHFSGYRPFGYNWVIFLEGSLLWLFSLIGIIKVLKSKFEKDTFFIFSWSILAFIFTIIPPAYGHYYTFSIPPLSIFAGIGARYVIISKQNKKLFFTLVIVLIILTLWLIINPSSKLGLDSYHWRVSSLKSYDQQVFLSKYIKNITSPEDKILIWGWEPSIYWLSERMHTSQGPHITCETFPLWAWSSTERNVTVEQYEKTIYQRSVKAIIFLPGYERVCKNMTREVFSNPPSEYYKTEFDSIKILYRDKKLVSE